MNDTDSGTRAQEGTMSAPLSDWNLLVALLGPTGSCNLTLAPADKAAVRERCDGFGRMSWAEMEALGCEWDWSHVRDSSEGAIADAASLARRLVGGRMATVEEIVATIGVCAGARS